MHVSQDDTTIFVRQSDGEEARLGWDELARVHILTTDQGPFVTDLFWVLETRDARSLTIPMGADGEAELLRIMQHRLEHFDNLAVVEAMGSTEAARFLVWQAPT